MTITKWTLRIGLMALLVASAGLVGCGDNAADSPTDTAAATETGADAEQPAAEPEQDLAAREREVEERLAELDKREAAVEKREAASTPKRATSSSTSPSRPAVQAPAEPKYRTVQVTLPASTALELEFAQQSLSRRQRAIGPPRRRRRAHGLHRPRPLGRQHPRRHRSPDAR